MIVVRRAVHSLHITCFLLRRKRKEGTVEGGEIERDLPEDVCPTLIAFRVPSLSYTGTGQEVRMKVVKGKQGALDLRV